MSEEKSSEKQAKLTCRCGRHSRFYAQSNSMSDISSVTGFTPVCDVSNGLLPIYLCPPCAKRVAEAWALIVTTCGTDVLSMAGFEKRYHKNVTEGEETCSST